LIALFMAGRGAGKSRSGGEWLAEKVKQHPVDRHGQPTEWLLIAETLADTRTICLEGPAGLLATLERKRMRYRYKQSPRPMVLFPEGSKVYAEGADDEDVGRGYNAAGAWLDEMVKWPKPYESWYEGILPSLRVDLVNDHPRAFITTTPKPIKILIEWLGRSDGTVHLMTGSTFDNAANLSVHVLRELKNRYAGTALGEQELYGKMLELAGGGLFKRMDIVRNRVQVAPDELVAKVVGVDPDLEDQMVIFDPESTRESPDRMDALVHACRYLMTGEKRRMRVSDPSKYDFHLGQDLYDLGRLLGS
jgi:phage terminase large subunit-like protein